jgi:hypothetical protein
MAPKDRLSRTAEPAALLTPAQFLALPPQPDGTVVRVQPDAAAGVIWRFRFNAASTSPYKWELDEGTPLYAAISASAAIASAAGGWSDLTGSVGPSLTLPFAGDYDVDGGATAGWGANANAYHGLDANIAGGTYPLGSFTDVSGSVFSGIQFISGGNRALAIAAAGSLCKLQYANLGGANSSTPSFSGRWLRVRPVRVLGP